MRIVETTVKQTRWRLARLVYPDGRIALHTGPDLGRAAELERAQRACAARGIRIEFGPNVVVEAALRPHGRAYGDFLFLDVEDGHPYHTTAKTALAIMQLAADGVLRGGDGALRGLYTFVCRAGSVFLVPYPGVIGALERERHEIAGVPDLSDLVRALGAPGDRRR